MQQECPDPNKVSKTASQLPSVSQLATSPQDSIRTGGIDSSSAGC